MNQYEKAAKKRLKVVTPIIIGAIPLMLLLTWYLRDSGWYLPLSLLILAGVMAPFFMVFEKRKPKAREIVLIAVLSAITVVVHAFFHVVIPVQIGTAMVIISGVALGPEAGFLIGALSRFVCNFYLGQGLWTPWQMFCWGLLGFLAGIVFNRNALEKTNSQSFKAVMGPVMMIIFAELLAYVSFLIYPGGDESFFSWRAYAFGAAGLLAGVILQRKRLPVDTLTLCLFTFFMTFVVYGGIMNFAAMITSMGMPGAPVIDRDALRLVYVTGFPYDLIHAGTATLCMLFLGRPMITKLERIKIKYGIYK